MTRILSAAIVLLLLAAGAQAAIIPGGDFEGGGPPGIALFGNTAIVPSVGTGPFVLPDPSGGSFFLESSTGGLIGSIPAGGGPAPFFTGDPAGQGSPIIEYSGFSLPMIVTTPSFVSFLMNFQTDEDVGGESDIVAVFVDDGGGPTLVDGWVVEPTAPSPFASLPIASFGGGVITDPGFGAFYKGQTGWSYEGGPLDPGTYAVWVLVADVGDPFNNTAFSLDNIALTPVPEPGTWLLFGLGALGLAGFRRVRRKKVKAPAA